MAIDTSSLERLAQQVTLEQVKAELSRQRFKDFVKNTWHVLEPHTQFVEGIHHDAICQHLEAVTKGEIKRLIVNIPPRFGKSILISVMFPLWEWINAPYRRYLCTSFKEALGVELSIKARKIWGSEWYQRNFVKDLTLTRDTVEVFENSATGARRMAVYQSAMGFGADRLLVDDPHNVQDALSDDVRRNDLQIYDSGLSTRLNGPDAAVIIVMQRLHQNDLAGHLIEKGGFETLILPNEYDPRRSKVTVIGWHDPRTEENQLLWPIGFDEKAVVERKRSLGSLQYAGQYQQSPVSSEGGLINPAWFKTWSKATLPETFDEELISADFTFKDSKHSDFVVLQHWGRADANYFLLHQDRFKGDFVRTIERFVTFVAAHPKATTRLIELAANGEAIASQLRSRIPGLIGIKPKDSKESRVSAVSPYIESGNVFIPDSASWKDDFILECSMFPRGAHDDQVDAMTQALQRMGTSSAQSIEFIRHQII